MVKVAFLVLLRLPHVITKYYDVTCIFCLRDCVSLCS